MLQASSPVVRPDGLVTVAFLKARLDEGSDHLGIFLPLVLDVIPSLSEKHFTTAEVQEKVASHHGVVMPADVVATLLKRAAGKHHIARDAGRYHINLSRPFPLTRVAEQKATIQQSQQVLGEALLEHARKRGFDLASPSHSLDSLMSFLREQQVAMLLGGPPDLTRGHRNQRESGIVADFLSTVVPSDPGLEATVRGLLEGLVLYNAAFLPDLASTTRRFKDVRVIFDSGLVHQALGYEGSVARTLMRETIALLRASNVRCLVLDKSLHETQRILAMYEYKLRTAEGRASLRTVPMARHFLTQQYTPADVKEMSALLEGEVRAVGFEILPLPKRASEFTAGEKALAKRLADPVKKDESEPRVTHDVDCIAGVLMLRKGHRSSSIEDSRAVFATYSPAVIKSVRAWWEEDENESGVAPIVHIRALANLAWLKRPSVGPNLQMRELVTLCAAALRPSQETWRRFLRHLERLRASNRLTSDELTAIVISALSDRILRDVEMDEDDPNDIDAESLDEVVERVKASYGARAEEEMRELNSAFEAKLEAVEKRAGEAVERLERAERVAAERLRRYELALDRRARKWAVALTRVMQWIVGAAVVLGAWAIVTGHPLHGGLWGVSVVGCLTVFILLELIGILKHVADWRGRFEQQLTSRLREWLRGGKQRTTDSESSRRELEEKIEV